MSGVGVSGLLANLPGTVTPYPTQDPALELGGYRSVANATARDAIPANFRSIGMVTTLQDTGVSYELFGGLTNADWKVYVGAPLKGNYYVNPTFTGIQLGSQSNPFTSITAAFSAAVAAGWTAATINLAPGSNTTENVTFPTTGEWNIVGGLTPGYSGACTITGNVDISASASARRFLSNVTITGNVTGNTSAGVHRITFEVVQVAGSTTLTISGSGTVRLGTTARAVPGVNNSTSNMLYTFLIGAVAVQGTVWGACVQFGSTLSCSGRCSFFNCQFNGNVTTTAHVADDNQLILNTCIPLAAITFSVTQSVGGRLALLSGVNSSFDSCTIAFSGVGINVFGVDLKTAQSMWQHGATVTGLTGAGPGAVQVPFTTNTSRLLSQTGNIGVQTLAFKQPVPMVRYNAVATLRTPGTAGNLQVNAVYTDSTGTPRTEAIFVVPLNVAGAAGTEAKGSLLVLQDGTANIQWSVTGIITPGALVYDLIISAELAN